MSNKQYTSHYRVYVEDTDLMGIIYHAKYLYFFERARTELLRINGISLTTLASYGTYFAIRGVQIRYFAPGRLDDMLTIQTCVDSMKGCTIVMKQAMLNQQGVLLAEAEIQIVTVDEKLKPKRLKVANIGEL